MGFFKSIFDSLKKTREAIASKLDAVFSASEIDEEFYEELEYVLISSDISVNTANEIIQNLKKSVQSKKIKTTKEVRALLKQVLINMLEKNKQEPFNYPLAMLIVGVNGVGKTTTLGKLAKHFKQQKKDPVLVAADTFRAAATEQLTEWAKKVKVRIIKHKEGADPSAVVYDATTSAKAKKSQVLLIDTAGRLHNKVGLMEELKKISRTVIKNYPEVSYKKYLVLDATTGQNAISQVKYFNEAVNLDGIILTKLDGTAKGGIIISIINEFNLPISFIGVGEKVEDLKQFDATEFVNAIL
jgi:fused signal recognition particle receptor